MTYLKFLSLILFVVVICSFKANAELPLPMSSSENSCFNSLTETQEFLLTGDLVMLVGFLFWIAYIVFFFPKDSPKKL